MIGKVDDAGRAMLEVVARRPGSSYQISLSAWIDTGFTGDMLLPRSVIESLGLKHGPVVPALLADGTSLDVATFRCEVRWFGKWRRIEALATDGVISLLGVKLLMGRDLRISYRDSTVTLR